jgi:hypothetical protein
VKELSTTTTLISEGYAEEHPSAESSKINELWHSHDSVAWANALERYWDFVMDKNKELEERLENLNIECLKKLDAGGWYDFLLNKYFRWKYTAANRYATTTKCLEIYKTEDKLEELKKIKDDLLSLDISCVSNGLEVARRIRGLGIAGASGLLSLIYPQAFGTVDQFVVKALRGIHGLDEHSLLVKMRDEALSINDGVLLINIMKRKARENNHDFGCTDWTPRKIDKVLWTFGR